MSIPVSKHYVDSMTSGITVRATMPVNPVTGDYYIDTYSGIGYIFNGSAWSILSQPNTAYQLPGPTIADLEKYPALKAAWEEYVVIRKLVGK